MRVNKLDEDGVFQDSRIDEMRADIGAYGSATTSTGKNSTWIEVVVEEKNNQPVYTVGIHGASGNSWHINDATLDDVRHVLAMAMSAEARFVGGEKPKRGKETAKERWLRLKAEKVAAWADFESKAGDEASKAWAVYKAADKALDSFLDAQGLGDKL